MASYEFTGTVKKVGELQTFASGFTKKELVVTSEEERFPQDIMFEFLKERASLLDNVKETDRVKVTFDLRGREYNGRYFNSMNGWKLEKMDESDDAGAPATKDDDVEPIAMADISVDDEDNLPF